MQVLMWFLVYLLLILALALCETTLTRLDPRSTGGTTRHEAAACPVDGRWHSGRRGAPFGTLTGRPDPQHAEGGTHGPRRPASRP